MNALSIHNYTARVEDMTIVDNVDLDVEQGETTVIMGPNGSGKSTLAKSLMATQNTKCQEKPTYSATTYSVSNQMNEAKKASSSASNTPWKYPASQSATSYDEQSTPVDPKMTLSQSQSSSSSLTRPWTYSASLKNSPSAT